jgi:hypothetical protein
MGPVGYGQFSVCVIHKDGLRPSSGTLIGWWWWYTTARKYQDHIENLHVVNNGKVLNSPGWPGYGQAGSFMKVLLERHRWWQLIFEAVDEATVTQRKKVQFTNLVISSDHGDDLCRTAGGSWMRVGENPAKWRAIGEAYVLQWTAVG